MAKRGNQVASMTGFGRAEGADDAYRWAWELRSVNGRGLDMRLRVGMGFERKIAGNTAIMVGLTYNNSLFSTHQGQELVQADQKFRFLRINKKPSKSCFGNYLYSCE